MMRSTALAVMLTVLLSQNAFAENATGEIKKEQTAETMLGFCEGTLSGVPTDVQSLTCTFRIQGVADLMTMNCEAAGRGWNPPPLLTAKPLKSNRAIRQTFINYMKDHPEDWRDYWAFVLAKAISEKFPCEDA